MIGNQDSEKNIDYLNFNGILQLVWKKRVFILGTTIIFAIISCIISFLMIKPIYRSELNIVMNMPEKYITSYGEYSLPITSNQQYINIINSNNILINTLNEYEASDLTLEELRNSVSIQISNNDETQNWFTVIVEANKSNASKELAEILYNNYLEYLNVMIDENAVTYFYDKYSTEIKVLDETISKNKILLKQNETLLAETPNTINQEEALQEIQNQKLGSDFIVLENIINPNYIKIENNIIKIKQSIIESEETQKRYTYYLKRLDNEKEKLTEYYKTGDVNELDPSIIGNVNSCVYLPSYPVAPSKRSNSYNINYISMGAIMGLFLSMFVIIAKDYWSKINKD